MRESIEVELTLLEKVGKDCWKFRTKPNESFVRVFESLKKSHVFGATTVYGISTYNYHYLINDEGMWILQHCFSNWDEMHAKATQKSPWEQAWQKRAEQGEPEQKEHMTKRCIHCSLPTLATCPRCHKSVCLVCQEWHRVSHEHESEQQQSYAYAPRQEQGTNPRWGGHADDIKINFTATDYMSEMLNNLQDAMKRGQEQYKEQQAKAEEERVRKQAEQETYEREQARQARQQEEFFRNYQRYSSGTWTDGDDDESEIFKQHKRTYQQQSYSNGFNYHGAQTKTGVSTEILVAFQVLGLPPAATAQEVKRKFRTLAKQGEYRHPDVGGSKEKFVVLNNAYELALSHAERNEVK